MTTVTLFTIPIEILGKILENCDLSDLIHFSITCKTAMEGLRSMRKKLITLYVTAQNYDTRIVVDKEIWIIENDFNGLLDEDSQKDVVGSTGVVIQRGDYYGKSMTTIISEDYAITTRNFIMNLIEIFDDYDIELTLNGIKKGNLARFLSWDFIKKCRTVTLKSESPKYKDLIGFLKLMKPHQEIVLDVGKLPSRGLKINVKYLKLENDCSFTINTLKSIKCQHLEVEHSVMSGKDFNKFLKLWMENFNLIFTTMKVFMKDQNNIFDGLKTMEWKANSRPKHFQKLDGSVVDCSTGIDIVRKDGLRGTILLGTNMFQFFAWPH